MRVLIMAALIVAAGVAGSPADADCTPGPADKCLNLDLLPQISQQIVAREGAGLPIKPAVATGQPDTPPYTGPKVGLAKTPRAVPTVGYSWSLQ